VIGFLLLIYLSVCLDASSSVIYWPGCVVIMDIC